jgi:RecB family exonuclease
MLKVVCLSHSDQKSPFLENFDETKETWLVSDLRSKFEVQSFLLARTSGYEDLSVYRASELWRLLLRRLRPELQIAPRDFISSWLTHQLKKMAAGGNNPMLQPQAAKSFLAMMDLFAPVFLHSQGPARLSEFFEAHPSAAERWKNWSELSYALFQVILREKWILPAWIPSILAQEEKLEDVWSRPLWVEMGAGLRQSEVELLKRFAAVTDVTVFLPELKDKGSFSFLLQPNEELRSRAEKTEALPRRETKGKTTCLRFSGPLAEVKQAVAQVRAWLEEGIPATRIALVAPEIEDYWPILEPFLEQEGIPIQKDSVTRLQSWPEVSGWLARLRLRSGQVSYSDLEGGLNTDDLRLRFEKFRSLYRNSLELEDLQQTRELERFFSLGGAPSEEVNLEEFMAWAARDWRADDWEAFEILLKESLQSIPLAVKLGLDAWIGYFESLSVRKEVRLKPADLAGIALINLSSVEGSCFERRIFLGMTESNFRKTGTVLVGAHELNRLGWDFGFFLDHPEQNLMNFELEWALQTPAGEDLLFFPATGFSGSSEAPHPVWIRRGGSESVHLPLPTRWDLIQGSSLPLDEKLKRDLGQTESEGWAAPAEMPRLSISALEKYRNCSFQFAAERLFHLLDLPERDLDLDARSKGSLAHKIFETLTEEPRRFDWTETELRELIDRLREEVRIEYRDGVFWEIDRERHVQLALRFLKFERKWREDFPQARIEAREKMFEFYFDPSTETFSREKTEGAVLFKGAIDRIETDSAGWKLIVDYKTSHDSRKNFANWIRENQLQLGFYSWVVDRGFVEGLSAGEVGGAVTCAYRRFEKEKGFVAPEIAGRLAPKVTPKTASLEAKRGFYEEFETLLKSLLKDLLAGKIKALPLDDKRQICDSCRWSRVCRAVHLND